VGRIQSSFSPVDVFLDSELNEEGIPTPVGGRTGVNLHEFV